MTLDEVKFKNQRALALIVDLAILLNDSKSHRIEWRGRTCARAAITSASLLIECVANSCLFSLALPAKLSDELDKLPALSKLDYYMFSLTGRHIDRGCREVELAADVIKLRDHVVHPKPKSGALVSGSGEPYVDYGATKSLEISYDVVDWDYSAAIKVSDAVIRFLEKYFCQWCSLKKGKITSLLVAHEEAIIRGDTPSYLVMPSEEYALIEFFLPESLNFLDIRPRHEA